jgi:hypothetical protein
MGGGGGGGGGSHDCDQSRSVYTKGLTEDALDGEVYVYMVVAKGDVGDGAGCCNTRRCHTANASDSEAACTPE